MLIRADRSDDLGDLLLELVPPREERRAVVFVDLGRVVFDQIVFEGCVCRQRISDSWLGNLREYLAHLV